MRALDQDLCGAENGQRHMSGSPAEKGAEMPDQQTRDSITVLPMKIEDVNEVHAIEKDSFASPWPREAFVIALRSRQTRFLAAFDDGKVIGYAGMRLGYSAHILNIAVHRAHRRKKIASRLLSHLLDLAARHGATCATLEVRVSNAIAQSMYGKFGFVPVAIRKRYYATEKEDAIVMAKEIGPPGGGDGGLSGGKDVLAARTP